MNWLKEKYRNFINHIKDFFPSKKEEKKKNKKKGKKK